MKNNFVHYSLILLAIMLLIGIGFSTGCDTFRFQLPLSETQEVTVSCATIKGIPYFCVVHQERTVEVPVEHVVREIVETVVPVEKRVEVEVEKIVEKIETKYVDKPVDIDEVVDLVLARLPEPAPIQTPIQNSFVFFTPPPPDPARPARLVIVGQGSLGISVRTVTLTVRVLDQRNNPYPGASVTFGISPTTGATVTSSAPTNSSGDASTTLTITNANAETYTITATGPLGTTPSSVTFTVDFTPGG